MSKTAEKINKNVTEPSPSLLPVGAFYVFGTFKENEVGYYYEWTIEETQYEIALSDVRPLWEDDNDSLLVWKSKEEMIRWANNNLRTWMDALPYWKGCSFAEISQKILKQYA